MKTLYVCGDSFLTPSALFPDTHFTEIISKNIGYELKVLAHGGMSNNGICLQIETAIKNNASFVIASPTYYDRTEIPIVDKSFKYDASDLFYYGSTYSNYDSKVDHALFSDSIISLLSDGNRERFEKIKGMTEKIQTLKEYLINLYNPVWKQQQDNWALYSAFHKLHISNIPYIMVLDRMNIAAEFNWVTEKTNTLPYSDIAHFINDGTMKVDPGYHTSPNDQIYIAEKLLDHIDKFKLLN